MDGEHMARRLLIITPVPERGAGYRYRIQQYLPFLASEGVQAIVRPFYSERLFDIVYTHGAYGRKAVLFSQQAMQRAAQVWSLGAFDAVFVYREALPIGPPIWEWLCTHGWRQPTLFDFDDAIFLGDTSPANGFLRRARCPWKVRHIIRWSRQVIAGNAYLASYARAYQRNVRIIPTPIDTARYEPRSRSAVSEGSVPVIGWIGTPTSAKYLESSGKVFSQLATRRRFVLKVVGAGRPLEMAGVRLEQRPWTLEREVEEFQTCDVGVYPLFDDDWSRGKCGFKALQFMACGVPVVASRVGMNCDMIHHGANGFLASSLQEWIESLGSLLDDARMRRRIGEAGRETVKARYSLVVQAPKFVQAIEQLWTVPGVPNAAQARSPATDANEPCAESAVS
jgi:glycosyltransferase involved in cell wall biosynthesis